MFAKVISGMDVVDKIRAVPTGVKNGMRDVPSTPVTIEKARKLTEDEAKKVKRDEPGSTPAPAPAPTPTPKPETPKSPSPSPAPAPAPKPSGGGR